MKNLFFCAAQLLLASLCSISLWAGDVEFPGSVPILLSNQSVRKDIGLTKSQCVRLDHLRANYKSDARSVTAKAPANENERKASNEVIRQLNAKYNASALAILTPEQRQRLDQVGHQTLGGVMLFIPRIQQKLQLSKGQIADLENLRRGGEVFANQVNRDFEAGKIDLQERLASLRQWRINQTGKLMRVLTREQKEALRLMQGKPLTPA